MSGEAMAFHEMGAEFPEVDETPTELVVGPGDAADHQTKRWFGVSAFALLALAVGVFTAQAGLLLAASAGHGLFWIRSAHLTAAGPPRHRTDHQRRRPEPRRRGGRLAHRHQRRRPATAGPASRRRRPRPGDRHRRVALPRDGAAIGRIDDHRYTVASRRAASTSSNRSRPSSVTSAARPNASPQSSRGTPSPANRTCPVPTLDVPLRPQTSQYTGRTPADAGGDGVEFYATREYRMGDPMSRIDWNQTAKTGDMRTVEHRVERSVTVALLVDARGRAPTSARVTAPVRAGGRVDARTQPRRGPRSRCVAAGRRAFGGAGGLPNTTAGWHPPRATPIASNCGRRWRPTRRSPPATRTPTSASSPSPSDSASASSDAQVILFSPAGGRLRLPDDSPVRRPRPPDDGGLARPDDGGHLGAPTRQRRTADAHHATPSPRAPRRRLGFDESLAHAMARIRGGRSV